MKHIYILLILLVSCCSPAKMTDPQIINEEAEVIKEVFFNTHLLHYLIWSSNEKIDEDTPLVVTPKPLIIYNYFTPPRKDVLGDSIDKYIRRELWGIVREKEYKYIIDQIFQNENKPVPKNLDPLDVKILDGEKFASYDDIRKNIRFYLSNVAFSLDKKVAVLFINSLGSEDIVILKKEYGQWRIISFKQLSIS